MLKNTQYEYQIYRTLRRLSKQRVKAVLQPGNVWLVDRAMPQNDETDALLKTCFMRGWVEPLQDAIPQGQLSQDGKLPSLSELAATVSPVWKLTDSGWSAIYRTHQLTLLGLYLTVLGIVIAL